jgi:hypothetical protein
MHCGYVPTRLNLPKDFHSRSIPMQTAGYVQTRDRLTRQHRLYPTHVLLRRGAVLGLRRGDVHDDPEVSVGSPDSLARRRRGKSATVAGRVPTPIQRKFFAGLPDTSIEFDTRRQAELLWQCQRTADRPWPRLIGCDASRKAGAAVSSSTRRLGGTLLSRPRPEGGKRSRRSFLGKYVYREQGGRFKR